MNVTGTTRDIQRVTGIAMVAVKGDTGASWVYQGVYDPLLTYTVIDVVNYLGKLYKARKEVPIGKTPEDAEYWEFLMSGGIDGPKTSVIGNLVVFADENGTELDDSGTKPSDFAPETDDSIAAIVHAATAKEAIVDTDEVPGVDSENSFSMMRTTWLQVKSFLKTYFDSLYATLESLVSFQTYHGVVRGNMAQLPTHITTPSFTLNCTSYPCTYHYQGTRVVVSSNKIAALDDGSGGSTAGLYFVYFNAATGNILCTKNFPGISADSNVIVATIIWNGVDYGLVGDERHSYRRNTEDHQLWHETVGVRYVSGIDFAPTGSGAGATFSSTSGSIRDEDIKFIFPASSSFPTPHTIRTWYQNGASSFVFDKVCSAIPFKAGANSRPVYVNANGYVLTEMASATNRYINFFVYGTLDNHTPLYCFAETVPNNIAVSNGYTTIALARSVPFPNLSAVGLSPELKPLYRMIVRADGAVQTIAPTDDYRLVSSLPMSAGSVNTIAAAISFTPYGDITSSTVQTAIQELDDEKISAVIEDTAPVLGGDLNVNTKKIISDTDRDVEIEPGGTGSSKIKNLIAGSLKILSGTYHYIISGAELLADRTVSLPLLTGPDSFVMSAFTQTLTNKRLTSRTGSIASAATPTINTDLYDQYLITAQAEAITGFTMTGTPTEGQKLIISITGTAGRTITWGSSFESSTVTLPTTTVSTNRLEVGFIWNSVTSKWRCIAKA